METMSEIIYDMTLISVSKGVNRKILENNGFKPTSYILKKYEIDTTDFITSNRYYSSNLDMYLSIYQNVLNKLEKNKQIISDSLKRENEKSIKLREQKSDKQKMDKLTSPVKLFSSKKSKSE
jgi:LPS O-antigen subunit length determinant protein (WzzB/FepE family)